MYFTREAKANYYDCDCNNRLKLSAAMKYMQQTSSEHLEALNLSPDKLFRENMVFLLSKMCVKIHRMPLCTEPLVVGTAPLVPRGVRFLREFILESLAGERLISAMSLWVLVDPASRRVLRPKSFPYKISFQEPGLGGIIDDEPLPKGVERVGGLMEVPVRYSHIDVNGHVNNTFYADFVLDALPPALVAAGVLDTVTISFQNEAKLGEVIEIITTQLPDGSHYLSGLHGGTPCFEALAVCKAL